MEDRVGVDVVTGNQIIFSFGKFPFGGAIFSPPRGGVVSLDDVSPQHLVFGGPRQGVGEEGVVPLDGVEFFAGAVEESAPVVDEAF